MRRMLSGVLVAALCGGSAMAQSCVLPAQQTAFNVVAMKSALMVGALSCGQGEQYDSFMTQFQPYILAEQHVMDAYFNHMDGLYGQTQEDAYVTQLANTQSQDSITMGTSYCSANAQIFADVLALNTPDDLNQYLAAHTPSQPIPLVPCPTSQAAVSQPNPAEAAQAERALVQSQPLPPVPSAPVEHVKLARNVKTPAISRPAGKQAVPALVTQPV